MSANCIHNAPNNVRIIPNPLDTDPTILQQNNQICPLRLPNVATIATVCPPFVIADVQDAQAMTHSLNCNMTVERILDILSTVGVISPTVSTPH